MFRGFNQSLPVYDVITPQTKMEFSVRTLTVADEEQLKASVLIPNKITEHLNECLYNVLVKKPEEIATYDDFLNKLTILDRDALLYGLYHITYEEERVYAVSCSSCNNKQNVTIEASKTFSINQFPGDKILEKRVNVNLQTIKGYTAVIKQPSLADEINVYKTMLPRPNIKLDVIINSMVIDKFIETGRTKKTPVGEEVSDNSTFENREDVIEGFLQLPAKDRKLIQKAYYDNFGQYCIDLKMRVICPKCGNEDVTSIDLVSQFFRLVLGE